MGRSRPAPPFLSVSGPQLAAATAAGPGPAGRAGDADVDASAHVVIATATNPARSRLLPGETTPTSLSVVRFGVPSTGSFGIVRVHVISDMEGVAGIVKWEQTTGGEKLYEEGRRLYTEEINAAVRGARAAGATEIVVMDCHGAGGPWMFNSLVPELLDSGCEYVVQERWTQYTAFLEEGCDAALFIGMHAMAGTPDGVMNHTVSGTDWRSLRFNGREVGETGINAALCGTWGCPVLLVTGDRATCAEAKALLGDGLTTVGVKTGIGRFGARQVTPARARELIEGTARATLARPTAVAPYDPGRPCEIEVELSATEGVERYRHRSGVEVMDPRRIVSRADDWWAAWRQFFLA